MTTLGVGMLFYGEGFVNIYYIAQTMKIAFVYIMTNINNTTFYIGVTNDIKRRVHEHKTNHTKGFTYKYNLHILVHFERIEGVQEAIMREKQLKNWHREWKMKLIEKLNPEMNDLAKEWYDIP
jgi:putative endonuclease